MGFGDYLLHTASSEVGATIDELLQKDCNDRKLNDDLCISRILNAYTLSTILINSALDKISDCFKFTLVI